MYNLIAISNGDTNCKQTWQLLEGVINDILQVEKMENVKGVRKNYAEKYRIDKQKRSQNQIVHSQTQTDLVLAGHDIHHTINTDCELSLFTRLSNF